jgi:hypothetical protein
MRTMRQAKVVQLMYPAPGEQWKQHLTRKCRVPGVLTTLPKPRGLHCVEQVMEVIEQR